MLPNKSSMGTQNISCTSSGLVLKWGDNSYRRVRVRESESKHESKSERERESESKREVGLGEG